MENPLRGQALLALRKEKKKQHKDDIDRSKHAEKKKRRLEKALATSAAIRSELEKKKQKKKEEQERLDEEGAAIAEAVALHVLLGEDRDESCQIMLNDNRFHSLDHCSNFGLFIEHQSFAKYTMEGMAWASGAYGSGTEWNDWSNGRPLSMGMHVRDLQAPYYGTPAQGTEISEAVMVAQAVSSLSITENSQKDLFSG